MAALTARRDLADRPRRWLLGSGSTKGILLSHPATLAGGLAVQGHLGIEPDRQRAAALDLLDLPDRLAVFAESLGSPTDTTEPLRSMKSPTWRTRHRSS
jgi:hypothetical protein